MHAAQIRSIREHLGLSQDELAAVVDIDKRSVRRWELGQQPIHDGNAQAIHKLVDITASTVHRHVIDLRGRDHRVLLTFQSDEDMWAEHKTYRPLPARWHLMLAARVAELVPGLVITYRGER